MYLAYPLPVTNDDDNQAAQSYLIDELLSGKLLIGNVRYNTGYAFIMAPVRALTGVRWAASTIAPFCLYKCWHTARSPSWSTT